MLFAQATRAEVLAASPGLSVGEVGKALGALWKAADPATKTEWEEKARALKAAYDVALADARTKDAMADFLTTDVVDRSSSGRSGTSYYKVIDGVRYDRRVLDDCVAFEKVNGSIDLAEARRMYEDVSDGPVKPQGRGKTSVGDGRGARHARVRARDVRVGGRRARVRRGQGARGGTVTRVM
jgi:hypothetical protein